MNLYKLVLLLIIVTSIIIIPISHGYQYISRDWYITMIAFSVLLPLSILLLLISNWKNYRKAVSDCINDCKRRIKVLGKASKNPSKFLQRYFKGLHRHMKFHGTNIDMNDYDPYLPVASSYY